jgi:hypothetical protein
MPQVKRHRSEVNQRPGKPTSPQQYLVRTRLEDIVIKHDPARSTATRRRLISRLVIGGSLVALCGTTVCVVATEASSSLTAPARLTALHKGPLAAAVHKEPALSYQVAGYTESQATESVTSCLASQPTSDNEQGAQLRDAASDEYGSTLVIATTSRWTICNVSVGGAAVARPLASFAVSDGWGQKRAATNSASDNWLTGPVEIDAYGGRVLNKTLGGQWLDVAVGRAASDVAQVSVQMPSGSMVKANVQNGYFVIREVLTSEPALQSSGTIPITGYDAAGAVVYNSQTSPAAAPSANPPCFVTPEGQLVTPKASSGQACQSATAW